MASTSEQNFRANLSQFRWARGNIDDSQRSTQNASSGNPFSRFYNAVAGDYIPLRSGEHSNEEEAWFALSRWERCFPSANIRDLGLLLRLAFLGYSDSLGA